MIRTKSREPLWFPVAERNSRTFNTVLQYSHDALSCCLFRLRWTKKYSSTTEHPHTLVLCYAHRTINKNLNYSDLACENKIALTVNTHIVIFIYPFYQH